MRSSHTLLLRDTDKGQFYSDMQAQKYFRHQYNLYQLCTLQNQNTFFHICLFLRFLEQKYEFYRETQNIFYAITIAKSAFFL